MINIKRRIPFLILTLTLGILSCNSEGKQQNFKLKSDESFTANSYMLFKPLKYVSKYETLNLCYPDSLERIFKTDSSSIVRVNINYTYDSVYIHRINLGGITLPINDSINYNVVYGFSNLEENQIKPKYNISYNSEYSKQDSNAYLEYEIIKSNKLNIKLNTLLLNSDKNAESIKKFDTIKK